MELINIDKDYFLNKSSKIINYLLKTVMFPLVSTVPKEFLITALYKPLLESFGFFILSVNVLLLTENS